MCVITGIYTSDFKWVYVYVECMLVLNAAGLISLLCLLAAWELQRELEENQVETKILKTYGTL